MKRKLVIFGNNNFAEMIAHYFAAEADREVVAFTAHEKFIAEPRIGSRPIVPFENIADAFSPDEHEFFVALEHGRQNVGRTEIAAAASTLGYKLASFVNPTARVSANAKLGEHCLVLENAVIQHGCEVGANNLIFANTFFGQSCRVGANNYFGSGFFADRFAEVGEFCVFGSQVRIAESVVVHDWAHIRAFETISESLTKPTIIHPVLRSRGHIVDKRSAAF